MSSDSLNLLDFKDPKIRTLHLSWFAFFLSFVVWFNHAPLMAFMKEELSLTDVQVKTLLTLNVALTIPSRVLIGMAVDRLGPRRVFSGLLVPMYAALSVLNWRLSPQNLGLLSQGMSVAVYGLLALL